MKNKDRNRFYISLLIIVVTPLYNLSIGSNLFPSVFFPNELIVSNSMATIIHPECGPLAMKQNINCNNYAINTLSNVRDNKQTRFSVSSSSKHFKEHRKVGNGKKTGWKIVLAVMAAVFAAVTLISILVIPLYESLGDPVDVPVALGVAALSLALCFVAIALYNKIDKATAHLRKPKVKRNRQQAIGNRQ